MSKIQIFTKIAISRDARRWHSECYDSQNIMLRVNYFRCKFTTPDTMFTTLEGDKEKYMKWRGELYLELHNGTYTTHVSLLLIPQP